MLDFIYHCKTHKVRKSIIIQDFKNAGHKMIDMKAMLLVQKFKWVQLYLNCHRAPWVPLIESLIDVKNLTMLFLANYDMTKTWTQSIFYKDVLQSLYFINTYNGLYLEQNILNQYLFYNKYLKFDYQYFYFRDIVRAGIWKVADLFDANGNIIPFKRLTERGVSINKYLLWRNIIAKVTDLNVGQETYIQNTDSANSLHIIFSNGSKLNLQACTSKAIYNTLIVQKSELPKSFRKYATLFPDLTEICFQNVCLIPRLCVKNNYLKELQYKIIHRYLPTNRLLYKMGKVESTRCTLCNLQTETISHLFYECTCVKSLWSFIENALRQAGYNGIKFECSHVVLGYNYSEKCTPKNAYINNIILYVKLYIWHVRKYFIDISVEEFKVWLCNTSLYDDTLNNFVSSM